MPAGQARDRRRRQLPRAPSCKAKRAVSFSHPLISSELNDPGGTLAREAFPVYRWDKLRTSDFGRPRDTSGRCPARIDSGHRPFETPAFDCRFFWRSRSSWGSSGAVATLSGRQRSLLSPHLCRELLDGLDHHGLRFRSEAPHAAAHQTFRLVAALGQHAR